MSWDPGAVRRLVEDAFLPESFETFCFDHFPDVYREFTPGMAQSQRVLLLVERVWARGEIDRLVEATREANPRVYEEHSPRLRGDSESATMPHPSSAALYTELCQRERRDFEEVVFRLGIPTADLPPYNTSQAERARALLAWCHGPGRPGEEAVATALAEVSRRRTWRSALAEVGWRWLSRLWPPLYARLVERGSVLRPPEERVIAEYLTDFEREMAARNGSDLVYISQAAGEIEGTGHYGGDFSFGVPRGRAIHQVRQVLRVLEGLSRGGDQVTAQLASVHRASRVVRNAVRLLLQSPKPLILLGDPGSGKSTTLREVGRRIAARERRLRRPRVVVYLPLGLYRSVEEGHPGSVFYLIEQSIPAQHARLRDALPLLIAEGRLVVLFDGMDEMERRLYGERVRALSRFARDHAGEIKTLFACRINDFMPEFEHRQMVLLPFDRSQVTEYARKNLTFPLRIDGAEHSLHRFVDRLLRSDELGETASNPLLLFLICSYVRWIGEWPRSRARLFQTYVERVYARWVTMGGPDGRQLSLEEVQDGWSRLAFLITSRSTGTFGEPALLVPELGPERTRRVVEAGRLCGLLLPDPEEQAVRFSHHRLQEYLAAFQISRQGLELDWIALLDTPRWQETLLNLVSLQPQADALQALQMLLRLSAPEAPATPVEKSRRRETQPLEPDSELLLADRVVLASHVLREVGSEPDVLPEGFRETFADALVYLASAGRPTTQVKMLWAWKNVADWFSFEPLRTPLRSSVGWVRDQAMLLFGSLSTLSASLIDHMQEVIALDFANGEIFRRLRAYLKVARQDESGRCRPTILWSTLWWTVYCVTILSLGAGLVFSALKWFPLPGVVPWQANLVFLVAFLVGLATLGRWVGSIFSSLTIYLGSCLAAIAVFIRVAEAAPKEGVSQALLMIWNLMPLGLLAAILGHTIFWLTFFVSIRWVARPGFRDMAQLAALGKIVAIDRRFDLIPWMLLFLQIVIPVGREVWQLSELYRWLRYTIFAGIGLLVLVGLVQNLDELSKMGLKKFSKGCLVEGTEIFALLALFVFTATETGRIWALWIVGAGSAVLAFFFMALLGWRLLQIFTFPRRRFSAEEWLRLVQESDPGLQRFILTRTNRHNLGLDPRSFLEVLQRLEGRVTEDPAASAYWRVRHELEQTLRQERLDGWEEERGFSAGASQVLESAEPSHAPDPPSHHAGPRRRPSRV